jgi:hypothetical protein
MLLAAHVDLATCAQDVQGECGKDQKAQSNFPHFKESLVEGVGDSLADRTDATLAFLLSAWSQQDPQGRA